jgi:hypothetical protein
MPALQVQNQSYVEVAFINTPVTLTAKDNQGNTFNRNTVVVDASAGVVAVNLPYIPSLADDLLTEVVVIVKDDTSNITINAITPAPSPSIPSPVTQTIGSITTLTLIAGLGVGRSIILRPVSEGVWSAVTTA